MNQLRLVSARLRVILLALAIGACSSLVQRPTAVAVVVTQTPGIGSAVQLDGSGSTDPQNLPLSYYWSFAELPAGSKAALNSATSDKPYFTADQSGDYKLTLIVSNGTDASDPTTVDVAVSQCGGNAPSAGMLSASPATPNVGQAVQLSATATDKADNSDCKLNEALSYAWKLLGVPAGSKAALALPASPTPSFTVDLPGDYLVQLVVTDSTGLTSAPATLKVSTQGACGANPPVVGMLGPMAGSIGLPVALTATVTDADTMAPCNQTESFSYNWQLQSLPLGSKAQLNLALASSPSFTPDVAGTYVVTLVVTDAQKLSSAQAQVSISVGSCGGNTPAITQLSANPGSPAVFQLVALTATVADPDLDPTQCKPPFVPPTLFYHWQLTGAPPGSKAALNAPNLASPSFTPDQPGQYTATLLVSDSEGHKSAPASLQITAGPCGSNPPTALVQELSPNNAGPSSNLVIAPPGVPLDTIVQASAKASSDADNGPSCNLNDPLSYQWSFTEIPIGSAATLNNPNIVDPWFRIDVLGKYSLAVVVTDSNGQSSTATFSIIGDPAANITGMPNGFSIMSLVGGRAQGFDFPRGVTKDGSGAIYVAQMNSDEVRKIVFPPGGAFQSIATFASGLNGPRDIAFDATTNQFFLSNNNQQLLVLDNNGTSNICVDGNNNCAGNGQCDFWGVTVYTTTAGINPVRVMVADIQNHQIDYFRTDCSFASSNNFGQGGLDPRGVAGIQLAPGPTDNNFTADRQGGMGGGNRKLRLNQGGALGSAGNNSTVSSDNFNDPRGLTISSMCATPRVFAADAGAGELRVYPTSGSANANVIARGFNFIWGLHMEDATHLLITDAQFNVLMRMTGPFCSL